MMAKKDGKPRPFRRAVLAGLGVLLPPLLTLALFLWAWSLVESYVLDPVDWAARSTVVAFIDDVHDESPKEVKSSEIGSTEVKTGLIDSTEFVQLSTTQWIPVEIYRSVKSDPGDTDLSQANANDVYLRYVRLNYLKRPVVIVVFLCLFVIVLYILGKFLAAGIGRMTLRLFERVINHVPIIRNVYSSVKQVTDFLFTEREMEFNRVVAVQYPSQGIWSIGFVTGESMQSLHDSIGEPVLSVLMPTSPMPATGFTITVPKSRTIDLGITVDQAIQFVVSCGVVVPINEQVLDGDSSEVKGAVESVVAGLIDDSSDDSSDSSTLTNTADQPS
ncbi:MAG TPA: hypothetical protein DHW38_15950 [Planctomycetaceae bacterium]|jgi:uncharacterized membrane protein|nr:hypothetical protein [Rhodopirellula sp.]HCK73067.1 hypothetical protein [Planctomycetaceae bacterium]HCP84535.1 hypothetical protein [Planctomycetaceae bacterium]|tara:strand:- start:1060 stop:2052 length:993 start_codon:yes stop_codon:yes gene_type:complete